MIFFLPKREGVCQLFMEAFPFGIVEDERMHAMGHI